MLIQQQLLGIIAFTLAFVVILAGIVGLIVQYKREKEQPEDTDERPPARVYRQSPCRIEKPLLDRVMRALQALRQRAEERQWPVDWTAYQHHEHLASKSFAEGNLLAAFQEYCRAMRPLTEVMLKNRGKDDNGPPVWSKNGQ